MLVLSSQRRGYVCLSHPV